MTIVLFAIINKRISLSKPDGVVGGNTKIIESVDTKPQ